MSTKHERCFRVLHFSNKDIYTNGKKIVTRLEFGLVSDVAIRDQMSDDE